MDEFEPVFTVTDYYDGPREGIANFAGEPHLFRSQFADLENDELDVFAMSQVDADTFRLALEDWAIWKRWEAAFKAGAVDPSTHPALPEERERHMRIEQELERRLAPAKSSFFLAKGEFRAVVGDAESPGVIRTLEVRWTRVDPRVIGV
jgi:hypothetical protein